MLELLVLLAFSLILCVTVLLDGPLLLALLLGLVCFSGYALFRGFAPRAVLRMIVDGLRQAGTILTVFALIGLLTALWRAGGTIAFIIYHTIPLIWPKLFVFFTFVLCALVSCLTGTSFGTVSTMGVICMAMGRALGIDSTLLGGAILSGIFYGDRCSPMSSSALLVCTLTDTDIFVNIRNMLRTAMVPTILSSAIFLVMGLGFSGGAAPAAAEIELFSQGFSLTPWVLAPALVIVVLSVFKVAVRRAMLCSIVVGVAVCLFCQGMSLFELLRCLLLGYRAADPALGALMNGGGLVSMLNTAAIVGLSSSYFGIFRKTQLLDQVKRWMEALSRRSTSFSTVLAVSVVTSCLSCNQTLSTMLTYEITERLIPDREELAVALEDSVIVVSALIPWSIACAFPLATLGAPTVSIFFAVYLYLLPLWRLAGSLWAAKHRPVLIDSDLE